ncbi:NADH-quinone oxidoreductase subunit J [bacterium]|nr:NADH-quinone oxidoreductase subunit J [bacterium]
MGIEVAGWWLMAAIAVACAVGMVSSRNPVHCALWLVGNFVALAVIFLILSAPVLFALQLIVYAGAIMVLFLFVIMFFMSPQALRWLRPPVKGQLVFGGILVVLFLLLILGVFASSGVGVHFGEVLWGEGEGMAFAPPPEGEGGMGEPRQLGRWLFSYHVLPFELTSLLLLAGLLGAVMVARDVKGEGRKRTVRHARVAGREEDEERQEVEA